MSSYRNIIKDRGALIPSREKEVPKPALDSSNDQLRLKKHASSGLKHAFLMAVIGDEYNSTITVHHPIGQTKLNESDWVMTPSSEVHHLLARAEDKSATERAFAKREAYVKERLLASGIVTEKEGVLYYKEYPQTSREDLLKPFRANKSKDDAAKKADHQLAIKGKISDLEKEHKARFPTRPFKPPRNITELVPKEKLVPLLDFVTDASIRAIERVYEESKAALRREAEKKILPEFIETVGGVRGDLHQQAVPMLSGKSQKQAIDLIIRTMMTIGTMSVGSTVRLGAETPTENVSPARVQAEARASSTAFSPTRR